MKTLTAGLLLAIASGLSMSSGQSRTPLSPQVGAVGANPEAVAVDPAVTSPRPPRDVARGRDNGDRDSVLGIVLLVTLQRGVHGR
jgi:hypothetical protein